MAQTSSGSAGPSGEEKTRVKRLLDFLRKTRMIELEIIIGYLLIGILFYTRFEAKHCESEECTRNCVQITMERS